MSDRVAVRTHWAIPSMADVVILIVLCWLLLFTSPAGQALLLDAGVGVHVRTGEVILQTGAVPRADFYSFSKPGGEWFAWEWLADVLFAWAASVGGLGAVSYVCGLFIAASFAVVMRHAIVRGATVWSTLTVSGLVLGASSLHYMARPHVITLLFFALTFYLLDKDRVAPSGRVWLLVPLCALWVNLHGGFVGLFLSLGAFWAGSLLERDFRASVRYMALAAACFAASFLNPYGWQLHVHLWTYLQSSWLVDLISEFQPPTMRSPFEKFFEILLLLGAGQSIVLLKEGRYREGLLVLGWAHAAITSARHILLFAIVAAPITAELLDVLVRRFRTFVAIDADFRPSFARHSVLLVVGAVAVWAGPSWTNEFTASHFPIALATKHEQTLKRARLFTVDQWADYLAYRFFPDQKVFLDGRSDFFGRKIVEEFSMTLAGAEGWRETMHKYRFDAALIPVRSGLAQLIAREPGWREVDRDDRVVLFLKAVPPPEGVTAAPVSSLTMPLRSTR